MVTVPVSTCWPSHVTVEVPAEVQSEAVVAAPAQLTVAVPDEDRVLSVVASPTHETVDVPAIVAVAVTMPVDVPGRTLRCFL